MEKEENLPFYDEFFVSSLVTVDDDSSEKGSRNAKKCAGCTAVNIADNSLHGFSCLFSAPCYWGLWEGFLPAQQIPLLIPGMELLSLSGQVCP